MDLLRTRQVDPVHQSPQTRMYGFFTHGTVPPSRLYSSGFLSLPDHLRRLPSPTQFRRRSPGHVTFITLQVICSRPTTDRASLATSLYTYRFAYPRSTRRFCHFCGGHALFFRTVPPANTLVRWVNENAFVLEVQTRPCPTLGRPVHLGFPHRLRPGTSPQALRIPPHGGHPALRSSASGGFRSALAVSSFRLRARLDVSIPPAFSGQRGCEPRFLDMAPLI